MIKIKSVTSLTPKILTEPFLEASGFPVLGSLFLGGGTGLSLLANVPKVVCAAQESLRAAEHSSADINKPGEVLLLTFIKPKPDVYSSSSTFQGS